GDVHALPGFGAVGVAGIAGDEHPRQAFVLGAGGDVVELVRDAVAHFVHTPPGLVPHVPGVGVEDLVGLVDDLLDRGPADGGRPFRGDGAEVDVHAEQVPALARDVQDVAAGVGLDGAFEADVGEVGHGQHIHDAPGVVGRLAQVPAADLGAHPA